MDKLNNATRQLLAKVKQAARPALNTLAPAQARAAYAVASQILEVPKQAMAQVTELSIPVRDGASIAARRYLPSATPPDAYTLWPTLVYMHGGGFTIGNLETHDVLCRELAHRAQCCVVALDYRLAPEHKFPTAVHDAWDALTWLHRHAYALGIDPGRMAVGGDSAGGTLATVCATLARDAGLGLRLQLLFYPGCAAMQDSASHREFAEGYLLDATLIQWFFGNYLATEAERHDWRFAPLQTPDLHGVTPVWLGLAECDPLVDEGLAYGDKLRADGVTVDLELYRGDVHGFIQMGRAIPQATQAHADAAKALRQAFTPPGEARLALQVGAWADLGARASAVRAEVFVREQGVPMEMELDEADAGAVHVLVSNQQGMAVATGRLLVHAPGLGRIGRMAVLKPYRNQAIGRRMLLALVQVAQARGDQSVILHAQCTALNFYLQAGFSKHGDIFEEAGIAHIEMMLELPTRPTVI